MILYKYTKTMVRPADGNSNSFGFVLGVLYEDSLAPFLFIIFLDYVLRTSVDLIKEYSITLKKAKRKRYRSRLRRW